MINCFEDILGSHRAMVRKGLDNRPMNNGFATSSTRWLKAVANLAYNSIKCFEGSSALGNIISQVAFEWQNNFIALLDSEKKKKD